MSDTWPDRLDESDLSASDADILDQLRSVDGAAAPPPRPVIDDIEVDPVDAWEQSQPIGGDLDDHDR